jgi:hypothetical protein
MTYACLAWKLVAVQCLQNKVLRIIGNFPRCTPVRDLRTAFNRPYVYDCVTKLCRQQTEVIQNHENDRVHRIGQGEARQMKLGDGQAYNRSSD